jgi:hypothetical protein
MSNEGHQADRTETGQRGREGRTTVLLGPLTGLLLLLLCGPTLAHVPGAAGEPHMGPVDAAHADAHTVRQPSLAELLTLVDDSARGESSQATIEMKVKTRRYTRSMRMEVWSKGSERSLIRILEPAKDRGVATLKVNKDLWNYLPNADRTMRVPSAMMSGSWMGSHFSNDDLVRESRLSEDYTYALAPGSAPLGSRQVSIRCTPKADTPVVWGYVDVVTSSAGVPVRQDFYSEKGVKVRTFSYGDLKTIGGQRVPMRMTVAVHGKPNESTEIIFHDLKLDPALDDSLFSLQALRD